MTKNDSQTTPPPQSGTGKPKPPKPNEVNLTELLDDYIETNNPRGG